MVQGLFVQELLKELQRNLFNCHRDNYDIETLSEPEVEGERSIRQRRKEFLLRRGLLSREDTESLLSAIQPFVWFFHRFEQLYDALADAESRLLLVQVIAFRILGPEKVRLPLNNKEFWKQRDVLRGLFRQGDAIVSGKYSLGLMDLNWIGYPIKLYTTAIGPQSVFLLKQYEYHSSVARIKAEMGDVVIDGGGCWGDTGLYFAHEVGDDGKVVSLEGIPENLSVMRKNLGLNGRLRQRIEVVELPLWSTPGVRLHFHNDGPSSRGSLDPGSSAGETMVRESTSIDALFDRLDLRRIDFIKMDIEGAELEALHGARETIIRFRPKLAISVYHSISDFVDVFEFLSALNLGYKYYLGHYTIHWHETVLFAVSGETA